MSTTPTPDLVNEALRAILTEVVLTNKTADKAELILLAQTAAAAFKAGLAAFEGVAAPTVVYDPVTSSMVPAVEQGAGPTSAEDFEVAVSVTRPLSERPATLVSVVRLRDSQPKPGLPVLKVALEAELTPSEIQVLADLLLSVVRRTRPGSARPAT